MKIVPYICDMVKQVSIPETRGRKPKYKFSDMKVGDSVLYKFEDIPGTRRPVMVIAGSVASWVRTHKSDKKFTCRTVDNGVRVWRIK